MQNNKDVFVGIENTVQIRREVLTSSISFIRLLERYEHLNEIRTNKENEILYLKNLLKDIRSSLSDYKNNLPWIEGEEKKKEEKRVKVKKKGKKEIKLKLKKIKPKKATTELDKLRNELSVVESKLAGISGF